ncbi:xylulokinase [Oleiagrimonas sp. C23AA]|uniref:xylulokinase n=1 Tax=Oleiagrimonas sp. C23AA TaxID=2719047 RepID=UPI0014232A6B|nr:xylulokinase [Oleiagrimonas sp. C23AA]NII09364.1 xylulokinase [Oleiagrimonas sp. C23AA]
MSLVAGIDLGTQGLKVVIYDPDHRRMVASASAPLTLMSAEGGVREQRADDWVQALRRCFAEIDAALKAQVTALAVSGQQHGFVPLDAEGEVLAPVKLWCDTSTSDECEQIMQAVGGVDRCIELAGNPIMPGYTASKLPWTRTHRPEVYAELAHILLPHDYLNFFLTGEYFCEYGDASGTGWLDVRTRQWSDALLQATDPDRDLKACLPPIVELGRTFAVRADVAGELGLGAQAVVAVGGGDNMMAAIGTGAVVPGRLAMSLGTSGTLFAYADTPVVDEDGAWAAFCSSSGGWLPLICTMNCTVATETVADMFGFSSRDGDARITASKPGAGGLTMLPFFSGERVPNLPRGKASLSGMDLTNASQANVYRAAMEGATYSIRYGYDAFVRAGMTFDSIVLTGGGANSAAWRQMVADIFNLPVEVPELAEGGAFGAALQALWSYRRGQGDDISLPDLVAEHVRLDTSRTAHPDSARVQAYRAPYQRFLDQLDVVRPLYTA